MQDVLLNRIATLSLALGLLSSAGCAHVGAPAPAADASEPELAGAWRSTVRFRSGAFAAVKDLEFMYAFAAGGTVTESSNYDAAPPVPPAYGVWRKTGPRMFEARYEFFFTKPAAKPEDLLEGGWKPAGRGVFLERITLAPDGKTFTSTIRYDPLDPAGKAMPGGGDADGKAARIGFDGPPAPPPVASSKGAAR